jgi:hypothetical protein
VKARIALRNIFQCDTFLKTRPADEPHRHNEEGDGQDKQCCPNPKLIYTLFGTSSLSSSTLLSKFQSERCMTHLRKAHFWGKRQHELGSFSTIPRRRSRASLSQTSAISSNCFLYRRSLIWAAISQHSAACCSYSRTFCVVAPAIRQLDKSIATADRGQRREVA